MKIDSTFVKNLFASDVIKIYSGNSIPLGDHFYFINSGVVSGSIGLRRPIKFKAKAGQFFSLKSIINPDDKVNSAVAETELELTMVKYEELDKVLKGTDKNLSALLKSLISQGIN